ncbi:MAG: hypothetical protein KJ971_05670 [Firmicutes bacterium]|nr:hypothetical protein [Bacillota bacterium]
MERKTSLKDAKKIMGPNFIGPAELKSIESEMGIFLPSDILKNPPNIQFDEDFLKTIKSDYILILGIPYYKDKTPLTIVKMRKHFGWDPDNSEPCFYNQDWYVNEKFAQKGILELDWYLIRKEVYEDSRGFDSTEIIKKNHSKQMLPFAVLLAYVFFSYYLLNNGEILWKHDFLWCYDTDHIGDQIYVGKYVDSQGMNKNGFSIHRHLKISKLYSYVDSLT